MRKYAKIVAVIPARSGSKGIPDKNIRLMDGQPLLSYSINAGLESKYIEKVIVSTDSRKYADIAESCGAEIPFLRPENISGDMALDLEVFDHYLNWLKQNDYEVPEIIVHLRPTHPIRNVQDMDTMIEMLLNNAEVDSVRSVSPASQVPYKMWLFNEEESNLMHPLVTCNVKEAYNAPRQALPKVYMQNACIDVLRSRNIIEENSMTGKVIWGYKMEYDFDIDSESEFLRAEQYMTAMNKLKSGKKLKICCDIDGIIAGKTQGNNYSLACPMEKNIRILQRLYESGNEIVLYTARGYATGINWEDITKSQMEDWKVPYAKLVFGKPDADFYIDDKLADLSFLKSLCN